MDQPKRVQRKRIMRKERIKRTDTTIVNEVRKQKKEISRLENKLEHTLRLQKDIDVDVVSSDNDFIWLLVIAFILIFLI